MIEDHFDVAETVDFEPPPRPKLVFGMPQMDPLTAGQVEAQLRALFPTHDIVILAGALGMMEVRG